jgi:hypothetical protein
VPFRLLSSAEQNLGSANLGVCASEISIQFQGPLALSDALKGAVGVHLDYAEQQMGYSNLVVQRQCLGQRAFRSGKPLGSIPVEEIERHGRVHRSHADEPDYAARIESYGLLETAARGGKPIGSIPLIQPTPALKAEVHLIGIRL